jgi:hypothetical protein
MWQKSKIETNTNNATRKRKKNNTDLLKKQGIGSGAICRFYELFPLNFSSSSQNQISNKVPILRKV